MSAAQRQDHVELELRDYLRVLRRRWVTVILITGLCGALALGNALRQTPVYEARSSVLLDAGFSKTILFTDETSSIPNIDEQVTTETDLMRTGQVEEAIKKVLGYLPEVRISAEEAPDEQTATRTIGVFALDASKTQAAKAADDFARAYVQVRKGLIAEDLDANIQQNRDALHQLDIDTANARNRLDLLNSKIPTATGDERRVMEAERDRLLLDIASGSVAERQLSIQTTIAKLTVAKRNNENRGIFKRTLAAVPTTPISPQPARDLLIGLLIGLGLGLAAAFLRDYYDDAVRTKEDLDRITGGVPVLGIIPAVKLWRNEKTALLESIAHPNSAASEAYRSLRTALEFTGVGKEMGLIHVTSSTAGEGKSTTAANLAVSLARAGHDVVLVDCDLRRPRAHKFFGLENTVGFTTVMLGSTSIEQALQRVLDVPGLFLLSSGPQPPNPSELLASEVAHSRIDLLARSADYVVIDSPPLLPVSDSVILAGYAQATLLVARARSANRRDIHRSLELLEQVDGTLAGVVLNGVGNEGTYGYGYGYVSDDPAFKEKVVSQHRRSRIANSEINGNGNGTAAGPTRHAKPGAEPTLEPVTEPTPGDR